MDMSLSKLQELAMDRDAWHASVHESQWVRHDWVTEQNWTCHVTLLLLEISLVIYMDNNRLYKLYYVSLPRLHVLAATTLTFSLLRHVKNPGLTERLHFHALEEEMATHSSVLASRIPGTGEPGGLPSMGSHRVRHDWSDLVAAAPGYGDMWPSSEP